MTCGKPRSAKTRAKHAPYACSARARCPASADHSTLALQSHCALHNCWKDPRFRPAPPHALRCAQRCRQIAYSNVALAYFKSEFFESSDCRHVSTTPHGCGQPSAQHPPCSLGVQRSLHLCQKPASSSSCGWTSRAGLGTPVGDRGGRHA